MTREERLKRLAVFLRDFNILIGEMPADKRETVRERFCDVMGAYLAATERGNGEVHG